MAERGGGRRKNTFDLAVPDDVRRVWGASNTPGVWDSRTCRYVEKNCSEAEHKWSKSGPIQCCVIVGIQNCEGVMKGGWGKRGRSKEGRLHGRQSLA